MRVFKRAYKNWGLVHVWGTGNDDDDDDNWGNTYLGGVGGAGYKRHKKMFANELTGNEFKVLMSDDLHSLQMSFYYPFLLDL